MYGVVMTKFILQTITAWKYSTFATLPHFATVTTTHAVSHGLDITAYITDSISTLRNAFIPDCSNAVKIKSVIR
jgi:hypothetical protein